MTHEHEERPQPGQVQPRRPRPRSARPDALGLQRLQSSAGNRAVAQLLAQQGRAAPVRGRPATVTVQRNEKFDDAVGKTYDVAGAPADMQLPPELEAGMKAAWDASFPDGKSIEQGGILVKTASGKYEWRAGVGTGSGSFKPNYGDVKPGEVLVASGHTHPYDASEGGFTDIAFSGGDLSNLVWQQERVKVVQSGTAQFAVAKTTQFDELVAAADTREKKRTLRAEMDALWNDTFKNADRKLPFAQRVEKAAKAVCTKYHLVYYAGSGGKVAADKPPKVHVEAVTKVPTSADSLPPVPKTEEAQKGAAAGTSSPAQAVQQSWLGQLWGKITGLFSG